MRMFLNFASKDFLAAFRTREKSKIYSGSLFQMLYLIVSKFHRIIKIVKP